MLFDIDGSTKNPSADLIIEISPLWKHKHTGKVTGALKNGFSVCCLRRAETCDETQLAEQRAHLRTNGINATQTTKFVFRNVFLCKY